MAIEDKLPTLEDVTKALERMNTIMPHVTSTDNGKIMQVDSNGNWVAEEFQFYDGGVSDG